jgi:hypothetical protein
LTDDQNIFNAFSKYFVSNLNDSSFPNYEKVSHNCNNTLDKVIINQTDVLRELLNMNCNKAEIPIILL